MNTVWLLERCLISCRRRFSEQQHAHCRPSHRGTWCCRNSKWKLHHHCVCSSSSAATRVHWYNGSNLRGWQCCWTSFGWCFHRSCILALVVSVYSWYSARAWLTLSSFYINLPIGVPSIIVILLLFKTPSTAQPLKAPLLEKFLQMDFSGTALIMASLVCYLLAMEWGGTTKAWNSGSEIAVLVLFPVLILIFILNEWWQGEKAQITFRILKRRAMLAVCLFAFL